MNEIAVVAAILAADWGAAATHMCYRTRTIKAGGGEPGAVTFSQHLAPVRLPFYNRHLPIWGDMFHLIAGLRYIPMLMLLWPLPWPYWLATALINQVGWIVLKAVHKKPWGYGIWQRWIR